MPSEKAVGQPCPNAKGSSTVISSASTSYPEKVHHRLARGYIDFLLIAYALENYILIYDVLESIRPAGRQKAPAERQMSKITLLAVTVVVNNILHFSS
jgi:hypothetical protein